MEGEDSGEIPLWLKRLRMLVSGNGGRLAVSRLSGVPPQTMKNYLSGHTKNPPVEKLRRIADVCGVSLDWLMGREEAAPAGFGESDVAPYDAALEAFPQKAVTGHGRWVVRNRILDLAGFLPGDVVEFRLGASPRPGEVVVAQLYDDQTGSADTLLRLYLPPYLLTKSSDPALDPRPIPLDPDGARVKIMGAFNRMVRERR